VLLQTKLLARATHNYKHAQSSTSAKNHGSIKWKLAIKHQQPSYNEQFFPGFTPHIHRKSVKTVYTALPKAKTASQIRKTLSATHASLNIHPNNTALRN
jgi:hypothetical protein